MPHALRMILRDVPTALHERERVWIMASLRAETFLWRHNRRLSRRFPRSEKGFSDVLRHLAAPVRTREAEIYATIIVKPTGSQAHSRATPPHRQNLPDVACWEMDWLSKRETIRIPSHSVKRSRNLFQMLDFGQCLPRATHRSGAPVFAPAERFSALLP